MELIRNGGFETGTLLPGWRQTPGSATLDGGVTDRVNHSGGYSLELRAMDFVEQSYVGSLNFATGPLSLYAKAASRTSAGPFFVKLYYSDGTEEVPFFGSLTTSWQNLSYPVDGEKNLRRIQFGTGEGGSIYIDDVSLQGRRIPLMRLSIGDWWVGAGAAAPSRPAAAPGLFEEMIDGYGSFDERLAELEARVGSLLANESRLAVGRPPGRAFRPAHRREAAT